MASREFPFLLVSMHQFLPFGQLDHLIIADMMALSEYFVAMGMHNRQQLHLPDSLYAGSSVYSPQCNFAQGRVFNGSNMPLPDIEIHQASLFKDRRQMGLRIIGL